MTLKKILFGGMVVLVSAAPAFADYYPSTLSPSGQDRHEFSDAQKENFPSGLAPTSMSPARPDSPQMPAMTGGLPIPAKPKS
ncbi:MAG: hypothetical protein ACAH27_04080 [Xanthobacteraceae bacterium]